MRGKVHTKMEACSSSTIFHDDSQHLSEKICTPAALQHAQEITITLLG